MWPVAGRVALAGGHWDERSTGHRTIERRAGEGHRAVVGDATTKPVHRRSSAAGIGFSATPFLLSRGRHGRDERIATRRKPTTAPRRDVPLAKVPMDQCLQEHPNGETHQDPRKKGQGPFKHRSGRPRLACVLREGRKARDCYIFPGCFFAERSSRKCKVPIFGKAHRWGLDVFALLSSAPTSTR